MSRLATIGKGLACFVAGAAVGGAGGFGVAMLVGLLGQWQHPNDPSAGSGAIIVMLTFPLGVLVGIVAGAYCGDRWIKHSNTSSQGFEVIKKSGARAGPGPRGSL